MQKPDAAQVGQAETRIGGPAWVFAALLGAIALLLVGTLATGLFGSGPWAWTVGLVYIAYDTWLLGRMVLSSRRAVVEAAARLPAPGGSRPTLAVVIAARDERAALPATLDALLAQDDPPEQILVVDDGSTDGTLEMLARLRRVIWREGDPLGRSCLYPQLRVLKKPGSGKARSLNLALGYLTEDLVCTIDADTMVEPNAIAALRRAFAAEPELWAACGVLTPVCRKGVTASGFQLYQTFEYLRGFLWRLSWMRERTLVLVSGAFAAFRREPLLAVGGFDATSRVEDYELLFRLHRRAAEERQPMSVRVIGEARAITDAPARTSSFLRQRSRWFAGFVETMFRHHQMVGNPAYGRLGSFHLLVKTVDTLLPIYGLASLVSLLALMALGRALDPIVKLALVAKLFFDVGCHLYSVFLYHRWQGRPVTTRLFLRSMVATITEPLGFQLLRQIGALLGWVAFLRGRIDWPPRQAAPNRDTLPSPYSDASFPPPAATAAAMRTRRVTFARGGSFPARAER